MPQTARITTYERDHLILEHYPMVRRLAYRMVSRYPSCVEADDLITIGTLGLIDAVDRFEESRSISFSAYARIRVQGAILDELRKNDWVPRSVRNRAERIRNSKQHLTKELGRDPTLKELAGHLEVDEKRLATMIQSSTLRTLVSMEEGSDDDDAVHQGLMSDAPTPMEISARQRVRELVKNALRELPGRERHIVDMYYFQDLTFKEIGQVLCVTESRVSQLHSRLKRRLLSRLDGQLMESDLA
jgi:RNA polymerase sigma factor for flagellar operon FliA